MKSTYKFILLPASLLTVSCVSLKHSGSDYVQPEFQPSANYKNETSKQLNISEEWWKSFQDSHLNSLQAELNAQNLDLAAAYARRQQALARLGISSASLFPEGNANGAANRETK